MKILVSFQVSVQALVVALVSTLFVSQSLAMVENGVNLSDEVTVQGKKLLLNGAGTREATFLNIKVYTAGLYLETKSQDAEQILSSKGLKQVHMQFLREVGAGKLTKTWKEAFDKNCGADCDRLRPAFLELNEKMPNMASGDKMILTFYPTHIEIKINQQTAHILNGPEYPLIMLKSWLGKEPPTESLKAGMLGKKV